MAPEAYVLAAALDGWIHDESRTRIRERAAEAYDRHQHLGSRAALNLFSTSW